MDDMWMTRRKELEPNVSMDEVYKEQDTLRACAHSVNVLVGVHVVKRNVIVDVLCHAVVNVVIGVHIVVLSVPLVQFYFSTLCLDSPCCDTVSVHPTLSRSHSFTCIFTVFSRHFRCGIYKPDPVISTSGFLRSSSLASTTVEPLRSLSVCNRLHQCVFITLHELFHACPAFVRMWLRYSLRSCGQSRTTLTFWRRSIPRHILFQNVSAPLLWRSDDCLRYRHH